MILFINEVLAFFVGLFFNTALLYLIHRRTPSLMRSYALILKIHAVSDLLFDITNFVTSTYCLSIKGRFYFVNGGIHSSYWTPKMAFLSVETYLWIVVYVPLGLVPLDFYYRLRAVCHGDLISKRQIGLLVAAAYTLSFIVAFPINGLYMIAGPSPATQDFDSNLQQALNVSREHLSGYLTMGLRGPIEIGVLVLIIVVINIDYSFIAYVVYQISKKMRENVDRNVSKKAEATQKQVTRIMFVQALIPMILCVPSTINICTALMQIDMPLIGPYVFAIISWLAAFKPIATICIVPHYRVSLFKLGSISSSGLNTAVDISHKTPSQIRRQSSISPVSGIKLHDSQAVFPNC